MVKVIKGLVLIGAMGLLGGCMTGSYSCPGMPDGVICKKPSEVYAMTNNSNSLYGSGQVEEEGGVFCGADCRAKKREAGEANKLLTRRMLEPLSQPLPVREAPQVMRVWVAPYNDENDDLHMPGFIFTEIATRKWSFGESEVERAQILTPMGISDEDDDETGGSLPAYKEPEIGVKKPIKVEQSAAGAASNRGK